MVEYNIDSLIKESLRYKDKCNDLDNALKYAMIAASMSYQPRADVCCCIGEIYLTRNNFEWAKFWYEKALNNLSVWVDEVVPSSEYFTVIPLLKLCFIAHNLGDKSAAEEYNNAVLVLDPSNDIALSNKKLFDEAETKGE